MAVAPDFAPEGLAALAAGPTVCGHDTRQRITPLASAAAGRIWCGRCFRRFERLVSAYRSGALDRDGLRTGLHGLLASFVPALDRATLAAAVEEATADIEDTVHAA